LPHFELIIFRLLRLWLSPALSAPVCVGRSVSTPDPAPPRASPLHTATFRREAHISFGGFASHWPLYYIPACYKHFVVGPI
jgi:hypothetical protein